MRTLASIRSILVPVDFSNESQIAFTHALRLAIALKADLEVLHVEPDNDQQDWKFGPQVIRLLTQWGYLGANATDADVAALGIHVRKTMVVGTDPDRAILDQIAEAHADLVVIGTHGRAGIQRLLQPSVTAPIATKGSVPVLFIPHKARSFVDPETGEPTLHRILIPVDALAAGCAGPAADRSPRMGHGSSRTALSEARTGGPAAVSQGRDGDRTFSGDLCGPSCRERGDQAGVWAGHVHRGAPGPAFRTVVRAYRFGGDARVVGALADA